MSEIEINLENLSEWYTNQINEVYSKHKKALKKFLDKLETSLVELKHALRKMEERKDGVELDDNSKKYLERFYIKIKENLEEIKLPESPTHVDVNEIIEEIKKLFLNMNELGRKNIRHFAEDFKIELKEIDMLTRKISSQMAKVDSFIRKKYGEVKDAELLVRKIPKLSSLVERIENSKKTLDNLNEQKAELDGVLSELENEMISLEDHPLYKEKNKYDKIRLDLQIKFDEKLKFKKALKKLKKKIESSGGFRGIDSSDLKKYTSNPIPTICAEGVQHPGLTDFLIQLRYLIEQGSIQMKADSKNKILDNIEQIVSKNVLKDMISEYIEATEKIDSLNSEMEKEDLSSRIDEIKENVSIKTVKLEQLGADINHRSNEYRGLLEKLKEEREDIQNKILEYVKQDIKIQITFSLD